MKECLSLDKSHKLEVNGVLVSFKWRVGVFFFFAGFEPFISHLLVLPPPGVSLEGKILCQEGSRHTIPGIGRDQIVHR
jgi:hypothetical protein